MLFLPQFSPVDVPGCPDGRIVSKRPTSGNAFSAGRSGEWKIETWGGRPCPPAGEAGIEIPIKGSGTALAAAGGIAGRDARATDIHK
jgi:hypothetical protein